MLDLYLDILYSKIKFNIYKNMCRGFDESGSLSLTEVFCAELICSMENPTVKEFAKFLQISSPNASYKIKNLVDKGYVKKVRSKDDKREYFLNVTEKYLRQYGTSEHTAKLMGEKIRNRFKPEDAEKFEEMIKIISDELVE